MFSQAGHAKCHVLCGGGAGQCLKFVALEFGWLEFARERKLNNLCQSAGCSEQCPRTKPVGCVLQVNCPDEPSTFGQKVNGRKTSRLSSLGID